MEIIKLLSSKIEMIDREGKSTRFPLSVLAFRCSVHVADMIKRSTTLTCEFDCIDLKIEEFKFETSFVLQIDSIIKVIQLKHSESWRISMIGE